MLPPPEREEGRLVFREPLRDTLVPLAVVGSLDLICCFGVTVDLPVLPVICLFLAALLSFLVAALTVSLFRRPEVVFDAVAGVARFRRPETPPEEIPLADLEGIAILSVEDGTGATAPAVGLLRRDGPWLPVHVGWSERRGGGEAGVRTLAETLADYTGLPLEGGT